MTSMFKAAMSCLFFIPLCSVAFSSDVAKTYEQAKEISLSAWASMAAYDDKVGKLAQEELRSRQWKMDAVQYKTAHSDVKYKTFQKKDAQNGSQTLVFSIAGTSNTKDIKSDLHVHTQPYRDDDPKEDTLPLVHRGFNTYATDTLGAPWPTNEKDTVQGGLTHTPRVILTGHSLGGAVATIMATRLSDEGYLLDHTLQVITFGAPSVGNKAYYDEEVRPISVKAIAFKNDPVHTIVQDVLGRYGEYTDTITWNEPTCTAQFSHSVVAYVEKSLHQYYDAKWAYEHQESATRTEKSEENRHEQVYIDIRTDDELKAEIPYIQSVLEDHLHREKPVVDTQIERVEEYVRGYTVKHKEHTYRLELERRIYGPSGNLLSSMMTTTDTRSFPPLVATLYCQYQLERKETRVE